MYQRMPIDALFDPKTIVVVGASRHPEKTGHRVTANLVAAGYKGKITPVNPAGGEIAGIQVTKSLADIDDAPDLAILCVPRENVLKAMRQLADKHVRTAVVMASGFKETGREGYYLEDELTVLCKQADIALLGPNSLGLASASTGVQATITEAPKKTSNMAFFSQSGALCFAVLDWALGSDTGFSRFLHLGNKAVIDEVAVLDYLENDPETKVILAHLESVENGQEFMRKAEQVTATKPVIMLKAGTTPAGARAVSNHTGALAGNKEAYRAAFAQSGIIQVEEVRDLFLLAEAFSTQPLPTGPNLCVLTNSGGPGILAADACENSRLNLARPSKATVDLLRELLPPYASLYNPIDIIGDADAERYRISLEAVAKDPLVHSIMVLLSPTASVEIEKTAQTVIDVAAGLDKPVIACFMGQERIKPGKDLFHKAGIPCYAFPEQAVDALEAMFGHYQWRNRAYPVDVCFRRDKGRAERVINAAQKAGLTELYDFKAMDLGLAYELPFPETKLARTSEQAARAAKKIGYPVALKVASPQIPNKSAVDGVVLNLSGPAAVKKAFMDITSRAVRRRDGAYITGCMVQGMARKGSRDVVVSYTRDSQFGALISFGLGGVHSEIMGDMTHRLAPLTLNDAQEMVKEIKAFPLLRGVRGQKSVDIGAIEDILLTVSQMAVDFPQIEEAVIGPIMADHKGALVVDMRVTIAPTKRSE